jgi:hypothetical protein
MGCLSLSSVAALVNTAFLPRQHRGPDPELLVFQKNGPDQGLGLMTRPQNGSTLLLAAPTRKELPRFNRLKRNMSAESPD